MNEKLKLPLTAVFSFMLGSVVFFPWGEKDAINTINIGAKNLNSDINFDRDSNRHLGIKPNKLITVKKVEYFFSKYDLTLSNIAIKNQLKNNSSKGETSQNNASLNKSNQLFDNTTDNSDIDNSQLIDNQTELAEISSSKLPDNPAIIVVEYRFSKDEILTSNIAILNQLQQSNSNIELIKQLKLSEVSLDINDNNSALANSFNNNETEIVVEYRFSKDEILASNIAIQNQLKFKSNIDLADSQEKTEQTVESDLSLVDLNNTINSEIVVEYRFSKDEIQASNSAIKIQLASYIINNSVKVVSNTESFDSIISSARRIDVKNVNYSFAADALAKSNLAIDKQLSRYLAANDDAPIKSRNKINISELEIAEKSETEQIVDNVSDYTNENESAVNERIIDDSSANKELVDVEHKFKQYQKPTFLEFELKLSNLAIQRQLRQQNEHASVESGLESDLDSIVDSRVESDIIKSVDAEQEIMNSKAEDSHDEQLAIDLEAEIDQIELTTSTIKPSPAKTDKIEQLQTSDNKPVEYEDESELLISNKSYAEEDDDEYNSNKLNISESTVSALNELDNNTELKDLDEEDDDEFSSERIVFSNEPLYFTDSFEKKSAVTADENIAIPNVEDINGVSNTEQSSDNAETDIEEIELIEEIEITDDGNIITSSSNEY